MATPSRKPGASTGFRLQQAAEHARQRQPLEARASNERLSIAAAGPGISIHIDLTPTQQIYRTENLHT